MAKTDMGLRLELFVRDREVSIDFYRRVLGFEVLRRDASYASLRQGTVTLGLGSITKLSDEHGHVTRRRLAQEHGLGIEVVLEVDDSQAYNRGVRATGAFGRVATPSARICRSIPGGDRRPDR